MSDEQQPHPRPRRAAGPSPQSSNDEHTSPGAPTSGADTPESMTPRRGLGQMDNGVPGPGPQQPNPQQPTGPGFGTSKPGGTGNDTPPSADQTVFRGDLPRTDPPGAKDDQTVLRSDLGTNGGTGQKAPQSPPAPQGQHNPAGPQNPVGSQSQDAVNRPPHNVGPQGQGHQLQNPRQQAPDGQAAPGPGGDSSTQRRGPDFAAGAGAAAAGRSTAWAKPAGGSRSGETSPDLTAPAPNRGDVDTEDKTIDAASLGKARVQSDDPEKNPFAPRPEKKDKKSWKDRLPLGRKSEPEAPVGRRVAERKPWFRIPTRVGKKTDKRNITAMLVTGAAVVLTIVVLAAFFMWNGKRETAALMQSPTPTAETSNDPAPLVTEGSLMTADISKSLDSEQDWNATQTSDQVGEQSVGVACVTTTPNGQPLPKGTFLRTLTGSGDKGTAALHRVDGFGSVDEAKSYFQFRSTEIGGCQGSPLYVQEGYSITGLGDEAVAVKLVLMDQTPEYHTVVLARTGQNVNIIDVAQKDKSVSADDVADAARQVINRQCGSAAGLCSASDMEVKDSMPPAGGDEPGFLAAGDIPRITPGTGNWAGTALTKEVDVGDGSNCEAVDFATVSGPQKRQQRTYLLRNDPGAPAEFGIDEIVLTMPNKGDAEELVSKIGDSIDGCESRLLTAKVPQKGDVKAQGVGGMEVEGRWFTVTQELGGNQKSTYRVAIVQSGTKVIYTRMNPEGDFDLEDDEWARVNRRAGQRATQSG